MKDLIEFIATRLKDYLPLLFRIVAHPRINIATLVRKDDALASAAVFAAVTLAIFFGLQAPLIVKSNDFVVVASTGLIFAAVEFCFAAVALMIVFKALRGRASFEDTLVATVYVVSPLALLMVIYGLVSNGIFEGVDPALAESWRRDNVLSDGSANAMIANNFGETVLFTAVSLVVGAAMILWIVACWPIYAQLNGFGRLRSIASCILGLLAVWGVGEISIIISNGLFPGGSGGVF